MTIDDKLFAKPQQCVGYYDIVIISRMAWWRHQMETFSALLATCAGQSPVTRSFDVFFDLHPNKRLSKKWWGWWFETLSRPLWHHCNGVNWTVRASSWYKDMYYMMCGIGESVLHQSQKDWVWGVRCSGIDDIHVISLLTLGWTMMTSSNGSIFRVTGQLCGEFTGQRWIPRTKTSDAEIWCFLWSTSE